MHNRNYIALLYLFVAIAAGTQFYIAYLAYGGIDIGVYWGQSAGIDFGNPRYYQEPVSWTIIGNLANFLNRDQFVLGFSIFVLLIGVMRLGFFGGLILYAAFLSPFGILMEFNILRQCIGTIFLIFFILDLVKDFRVRAALWGIVALLSHNSLILIMGFLVFCYYFYFFGRDWKIISTVMLVSVVFVLQLFGGLEIILGSRTESFTSNVVDAGLQNAVYFAFAMAFCVFLYFFTQQRKWRPVAVALAASLLFTLAVTFLLALDAWVYGRMAITVIVIGHFLLLYDAWEMRKIGLAGSLFLGAVMTANAVIILYHPGAMTMILGYYA